MVSVLKFSACVMTCCTLPRCWGSLEHSKTVLLHLPRAFRAASPSASAAAETLLYDACIARAVSRASSSLIIVLDEEDYCCEVVSNIYSTAWECATVADNCELEVNVLIYGFLPRDAQNIVVLPEVCPRPNVVLGVAEESRMLLGAGREDSAEFESLETIMEIQARGIEGAVLLDDKEATTPKLKRVAVGGTFDRLHSGHKKLLTAAAELSCDSVLVGLATGDLIGSKQGAKLIQPFETRAAAVARFLAMIKPELKVDVVALEDPMGPALTDQELEGLVVSSETLAGGGSINSARTALGLGPLVICVMRRTQQASLSSSGLRNYQFRST
mmetsp:Transcript_69330/g.156701  ORF Transcript_69330/g.156701 Transcript_69330/m.156701 type:complete len:329 (+) Transcript_69330:145-1131(+)